MAIFNLAAHAQVAEKTARKIDEKASEVIDNTIDNLLSKKKKNKSSEKKDPNEVGEKINKNNTVTKVPVEEGSANTGIIPAGEKSASINGKYVAHYENLVMGDQQNTKNGQFLIPATGQCVDVDAAYEMQSEVGMVFFRGYAGAQILTFPGNARDAAVFESVYNEIGLFTEETNGVDAWEQENVNSGDMEACSMSQEKFKSIASGNSWKIFNSAFIAANGGSNKVGGSHSVGPENGTVYLIKFNDGLRALMLVKNVISSGSKGGSIRFDIVVECKAK